VSECLCDDGLPKDDIGDLRDGENLAMQEPGNTNRSVIIVGPPWPRAGTARVMQSQVDFYRDRGYKTIFICVALFWWWTESFSEWEDVKKGMEELGADRAFFAPIDRQRFRLVKYRPWIKPAFRGTALDWIVSTGNAAQLPQEVIHELRQSDVALVHVNHVFTLRFAQRLIRRVSPSARDIPIILETHDIQARALEERSEINPWTHRLDSTERLVESEISYLKEVKVLVHLSEEDFRFFQERLPHQEHVLALPTIDESFISAAQNASNVSDRTIDLLFVGQRTDANCAAIEWFFERVWPLIAERRYKIKIVGQIEIKVRELLPAIYQAHKSCFTGIVEELAPFYGAARCVFAPMVSGTGISIKTVEALALGKPFVGTPKAYRGMPMERIVNAGLRAYDTPEDFADAIINVLSKKNDLEGAARRAYADLFSKHAAYVARDRALSLAMASHGSPSGNL